MLHAAPAIRANRSPTIKWIPGGILNRATQMAAMAPMNIWPSAPMLNIPARTHTENVSAVRMSGVARASVLAHS
jgi:hypothetical protein